MENIFQIDGEDQSMPIGNEIKIVDMEGKFISSVVNLVMEALNVNYNERRIVSPLLSKILDDKMNSHYKSPGLLQQYEAYVLDKSSERIKEELNIPKDINVNHGHALHAKFADIVKYIKNNYKFEDGLDKDDFKL